MERAVVALLVFLLSGCAQLQAVKDYPSRERAWCYPKAKYERVKKQYFAGIACYF